MSRRTVIDNPYAQTPYLTFVDSSDIHGALLTLTELDIAYRDSEPKDRVEFKLREVCTESAYLNAPTYH